MAPERHLGARMVVDKTHHLSSGCAANGRAWSLPWPWPTRPRVSLGGDVPPAELPASVRGGINRRQTRGCERARKRDGTVGRSDAVESSLARHRDSDPV